MSKQRPQCSNTYQDGGIEASYMDRQSARMPLSRGCCFAPASPRLEKPLYDREHRPLRTGPRSGDTLTASMVPDSSSDPGIRLLVSPIAVVAAGAPPAAWGYEPCDTSRPRGSEDAPPRPHGNRGDSPRALPLAVEGTHDGGLIEADSAPKPGCCAWRAG